MPELFTISDLHLGHKNILKFKTLNGALLRPFHDIPEMHATIIIEWNRVVGPKDKVYVLGDVCMVKHYMCLFDALNGKKALIRGNHDSFSLATYRRYFYEVYGVRQIDGVWFTHVPMHPMSVHEPRVKGNAHGHLHSNTVGHHKWRNVCVEQTGYRPIAFDDLVAGFTPRSNDSVT